MDPRDFNCWVTHVQSYEALQYPFGLQWKEVVPTYQDQHPLNLYHHQMPLIWMRGARQCMHYTSMW